MSNDDKFFDRLRNDARSLRYEPDDVMRARLAARIRARVAVTSQPGVVQLLARWFRPLAASLAALALAAPLSVVWIESSSDPSTSLEALSSHSLDLQMDGENYSVVD